MVKGWCSFFLSIWFRRTITLKLEETRTADLQISFWFKIKSKMEQNFILNSSQLSGSLDPKWQLPQTRKALFSILWIQEQCASKDIRSMKFLQSLSAKFNLSLTFSAWSCQAHGNYGTIYKCWAFVHLCLSTHHGKEIPFKIPFNYCQIWREELVLDWFCFFKSPYSFC